MSTQSQGGLADTPEEEMLLVIVGFVLFGALLASAGALWLQGSLWLVEHHVLVPASAAPLVEVPGTAGAGLDLARLLVLAASGAGAAVMAISALCRYYRRTAGERG